MKAKAEMYNMRVEHYMRECKGKSVRFLARRFRQALESYLTQEPPRYVTLDMPPEQFVAIQIGLEVLDDSDDLDELKTTFEQIADGPIPDLPQQFKVEDAPLYLLVFGELMHIRDYGADA